MSQIVTRSNLSASVFPFYTSQMGRSIILPQYDQNYEKTLVSTADADKDKGIPQVFYMHNSLPTGTGFQSVGYDDMIDGIGVSNFDRAITIRDVDENKMFFSPAAGVNYVYDVTNKPWKSISPIPIDALPANALVTTAYLQGETYIYYEKYGCFKYNSVTKVFDAVVLGGLVANTIRGICQSAGYMIAFDINNTAYWSSGTDVTDFVPSLATGAGSGAITDIKGPIVGILSAINGFIVYTTNNMVSATFTGNIRYPFQFKEVAGSLGISDIEQVAFEANFAEHYAWTSGGVQKVDKTSATLVYPELSLFMANRLFEDFNEATTIFTTTYATRAFKIKLAVVGKYFIFSYGLTSLTHAMVYDSVLKRWGKLKITHVDCFEYTYPNFFGVRTYDQLEGFTYDDLEGTSYDELSTQQSTSEPTFKNVGFLLEDGTVKLLNLDLTLSPVGVFLIGKYQFVRSRLFTLHGFEIENPGLTASITAYTMTSYDGKIMQPAVAAYKVIDEDGLVSCLCKVTGINTSILIVGAFNLVSIVITFNKHGQR